MWFWNWKILNSQPSHLWIDLELCLFWWECDLKRKKKDGDGKRENYDHLHHVCVALLQFSRTYTFPHPPAVCLQTFLCCNWSDIYICTWSLSASFHYLEPDLERWRLDWMPHDWNECRTKCTWKSYFVSKLSCTPYDRVTCSVCVSDDSPIHHTRTNSQLGTKVYINACAQSWLHPPQKNPCVTSH